MNRGRRITRLTLLGAAGLAGVLLLALWLEPPPLLRVGANYAAKIVCSNVFLAGRDPAEVLREDVQAPGVSLLKHMRVSVDRTRRVVRAGLFGFIGRGRAVARERGGCVVLGAGSPPPPAPSRPAQPEVAVSPAALWPEGDRIETDPAMSRVLEDERLTGPATRAVVVVHGGRIVAERYGRGFDAHVPQIGWSMTKSVTAGLVGVLVAEGRLSLERKGLWPAGDGRQNIRVADLLAMSSGLRWNESHGAVSDLTRMLFLEPDMAAFAEAKPLAHPVGSVWSYSSGTAVVLARLVQDAAAPGASDIARALLFDPLGMQSAVMESDAHGTLVGSSYMYATPRDWARYGQFLLQQGFWNGRQILPPGYVHMMTTPAAASNGEYGEGMVWLWGTDADKPGENPDRAYGLPADTFWLEGHDNQFIAVVPSRALVIVRLGLTPSRMHYRPQPLVRAVLDAAG